MQTRHIKSSLVNLTLGDYSRHGVNGHSTLYFVILTGLTRETCSPRLISAKNLCVDLNTEWLSEQDLLTSIPQNNCIYVLDPFAGTACDYLTAHFLKSKTFMVIGPQCIKHALQQSNAKIQSKGYPFCNLAMQNLCITLSGFSKDVTAELTDLIRKMNGVVSKAYSAATTHVVARTTLTLKCREAYKNDVAVMKEDWIRTVWVQSQDEIIDATDVKFIQYNCPIFHNIRICVSQTLPKTKASLKKTITENGGFYSNDLDRHAADVLVIPLAAGKKYEAAQEWKVPCVTPNWVYKSREYHVLPFESFEPPTPPEDFSCSTQIESHSDPDQTTSIQVPDRVPVNDTHVTEISGVSENTLSILKNASSEFLDSCTIYLCGHTSGDEKIGEIRRVLNSSGAIRLNEISSRLSHVLVINGKISEQETQMIQSLDHEPHVVSLEWLLESAKQNSPADEKSFQFEIPFVKQQEKEKVAPQTTNLKAITSGKMTNLAASVRTTFDLKQLEHTTAIEPEVGTCRKLGSRELKKRVLELMASSSEKIPHRRVSTPVTNRTRVQLFSDDEKVLRPYGSIPKPLNNLMRFLTGCNNKSNMDDEILPLLPRQKEQTAAVSTGNEMTNGGTNSNTGQKSPHSNAKSPKSLLLQTNFQKGKSAVDWTVGNKFGQVSPPPPPKRTSLGFKGTENNVETSREAGDTSPCKRLKENDEKIVKSFILSGITAEDKTAAVNLIERLGGTVSNSEFYDATVDAVIAQNLTKSEKVLGGVAGGKPILHPKYLTACQNANRFLEFDKFRWKEEDASTESEKILANVANFWYEKIRNDPKKMPFATFRVFLADDKDKKKEAYKRLIEAGGGMVLSHLKGINLLIGDGQQALGQAAMAKVPVKRSTVLCETLLSLAEVNWLEFDSWRSRNEERST